MSPQNFKCHKRVISKEYLFLTGEVNAVVIYSSVLHVSDLGTYWTAILATCCYVLYIRNIFFPSKGESQFYFVM